jgi:hypothetical protein
MWFKKKSIGEFGLPEGYMVSPMPKVKPPMPEVTIRDQFALAALPVIAKEHLVSHEIAERAYFIADEMLENKRNFEEKAEMPQHASAEPHKSDQDI